MTWLWSNLDLVGELILVHLALSVPAIILSFVISVPIGWLAHRYRWSRAVLLSLCALLYAIPSLAIFVALPPITGLGLRSPVNLVIALTLYGIAVIVRTAADAFDSVEPDVRQSATAIGYSGPVVSGASTCRSPVPCCSRACEWSSSAPSAWPPSAP